MTVTTIRLDELTGMVVAVDDGHIEALLEGRDGRLRAPIVPPDGQVKAAVKQLVDPLRPYAVYIAGQLSFRSKKVMGERVRHIVASGMVAPELIKVIDERTGEMYHVVAK